MEDSINVLVLAKQDGQRYCFLYHDGQENDLCRRIGRMAANENLSLTWHDAARLAKRVRKAERKCQVNRLAF